MSRILEKVFDLITMTVWEAKFSNEIQVLAGICDSTSHSQMICVLLFVVSNIS